MSEFDIEMQRMLDLDMAVRNYLSHSYAYMQGVEESREETEYWFEQLELLTSGEPWEVG